MEELNLHPEVHIEPQHLQGYQGDNRAQKAHIIVRRKYVGGSSNDLGFLYDEKKKKIKTTHFGQKGSSDFTINKDKERKQRYLTRHEKRENWDDYMTAGSLSRWILWNKPTLKASISDYKRRFKLKTY